MNPAHCSLLASPPPTADNGVKQIIERVRRVHNPNNSQRNLDHNANIAAILADPVSGGPTTVLGLFAFVIVQPLHQPTIRYA